MPCFFPIPCRKIVDLSTGVVDRQPWFADALPDGYAAVSELAVPCARCDYCLMQRARDWSLRLVHELQYHEHSCFLTLTYDDFHLPRGESGHPTLVKEHWQKFIDRVRKRFGAKIMYYHCGEYGSLQLRPHYHAVVYGLEFKDLLPHSKRGNNVLFTSATLQSLWPFGYSCVGTVTLESCAYVARYCMKKLHKKADLARGVLPEYSTMSLKPAIGKKWFEEYGHTDLYPKDFCTHLGRLFRVPRQYDRWMEVTTPDVVVDVKAKRRQTLVDNPHLLSADAVESCKIHMRRKLRKLVRELD